MRSDQGIAPYATANYPGQEGDTVRNTTLCYVRCGDEVLMLHRIKKAVYENKDKWIGLGGHLLEDETPEECVRREVREEAGLELRDLRLRGILTFILPDWGNELTFLYTAKAEDLPLPECAEGVLQWVPMDRVMPLPLCEGDRVFLPLLQSGSPFFSMKLIYAPGGVLLETSLSQNPEA
jgi:8-oxo-dGTP diphosphatase